jgi:hypothetical protein
MSRSALTGDLAVALQVLERGFGPLQVLDVHPTPPERRPAPAPAPDAAGPQPSLFDPAPEPELAPAASTSTTDPYSHIPPSRRWREVLRHTGAPLAPTPPTRRTA